MAVAVRRTLFTNPRAQSAALHGKTRSDHVHTGAMAEELVDRGSGADEIVTQESFNEEGSVEEIFGNCPPYEPPSARNAKDGAEEPQINRRDTELSADKNSMCDREDAKDAEQEPKEIGDEIMRKSLPKGFTKSRGKTTKLSYPGPILLSDDWEDERSTPRRRISRIKARSKYLSCIQQFWPIFPRMSTATTEGRGST
jgi:hypothetical protein